MPTLSKVLERAIHMQLYDYLDRHQLFTNKQFSFSPEHSTLTALSSFADELLCGMEKGNLCGALFLDLSKAFDMNHDVLLSRLSSIGVCPSDLLWFKSYLDNRLQCTSCGDVLSDPLPVSIGVPQGSILGPFLFLVYVNDLPDCMGHSNVSLYADDTVLYCTSFSAKDLEDKLNSDMVKISHWLHMNKLSI